MAIAFRAATTAYNAANPLTISKPAGTVAGDVLVMFVGHRGTETITTGPAGWTLVRSDNTGAAAADWNQSCYVKVASGEPASWDVTFSGNSIAAAACAAFSGVDNSTPTDVNGGQANNSTANRTAPTVTTTVADALLVGGFGGRSADLCTPHGAMTERADAVGPGGSSMEIATEARPTAGATGTRTAVAAGSADNVGQLVALRPLAAILLPSAIATAETHGTAAITVGPAMLTPTGIATGGALGTPSLATHGPITGAGGIASGFASGLPTVLTFGGAARLIFEVALNTGPGGSPVWTDMTDRLIDFDVFRGKPWRLVADEKGPGTFTLLNTDRALDPLYAAGPYFGDLKVRRRARLRAVWVPPPAGPVTTYDLWHGFVRRYRQQLDGAVNTVRLEALGPLWLTEDDSLAESAIAAELLKDEPAVWWPLGGATDAGLFDRLGRHGGRWIRAKPSAGSIVPFAKGGASYMHRTASGGIVVAPTVATGYPSTWLGFVQLDPPGVAGKTQGIIAQLVDPANPTTTRVQFRIATAADSATHEGKLLARVQNGGQHRAVVATGERLDDGLKHLVMAVFVSSSSIVLIVDGEPQATTNLNTGTPTWPAAATTWTIGNALDTSASDVGNTDGLAGYLQELVIFNSDQQARADAYHDAAMFGWGSSRSEPRPTSYMVERLLDVIDFPAGYRTIETGVTDVAGVVELPGSAFALLKRLARTEDGRLFETASGGLFFRSRDSYLNAPLDAAVATFGNGPGEVHYEKAQPVDPADRLVTRASVGRVGGIVAQSDAGAAVQEDFGIVGDAFTDGLHVSDAFAAAAARWRTVNFGDVRTEFETIVLAPSIGDNDQTLHALVRDLDDRVRVLRRPPPEGSAAQDVTSHIAGIRHRGNRKSWRTTFSLTVALDVEPYLELGHATRGKLSDGRVVVY